MRRAQSMHDVVVSHDAFQKTVFLEEDAGWMYPRGDFSLVSSWQHPCLL